MQTHEFTLILSGLDAISEDAANSLFAAGCDDATPCSRDGVAYVHFDREAESLEDAIRSAMANVRAAGFDVARVESEQFNTISRFNQELAHA